MRFIRVIRREAVGHHGIYSVGNTGETQWVVYAYAPGFIDVIRVIWDIRVNKCFFYMYLVCMRCVCDLPDEIATLLTSTWKITKHKIASTPHSTEVTRVDTVFMIVVLSSIAWQIARNKNTLLLSISKLYT